MKVSYVAPFVEFVFITGDALLGSVPQNGENSSLRAGDLNDFEIGDDSDWEWLT